MMYYYESLLLTPGPTPVPDEITHASNLSMVGHRSSDLEAIAEGAFNHLEPTFGTKNKVMIFTSNGTNVLEVSMLSIADPEDHFAVITSGASGSCFKQITETYYKNVHVYDVEWGKAVGIKVFETYLHLLNYDITVVFTQSCETSTAILHPIHELGKVTKAFN